jgi:hypothetical protein
MRPGLVAIRSGGLLNVTRPGRMTVQGGTRMLKTPLLVGSLALALAPAAFAHKPTHPQQSNKDQQTAQTAKTPRVMYVLHGTLSGYQAATTTTPGSVTIMISATNHHAAALKGKSLTFTLPFGTKIVLGSASTISDGDHGIVKIRTAKKTDLTTQTNLVPKMVIDQGSTTP